MKKQNMEKCSRCEKYTHHCTERKMCIYGMRGDEKCATDQFKPRLMKMAQAIFEAVSMGGGEIWKYGCCECELTVTRDLDIDFYQEQYHKRNNKLYFVCPLPPVTFGWHEALERLQRGEEVHIDGTAVILRPKLLSIMGTYYDFIELKDRRFTAVT